MNDVSKYVKQLEAERVRIGKEPFSTEERVLRLNRIYDSLLVTLEKQIVMGRPEKTYTISTQLQATRLEMYELQRQYGSVDESDNEVVIDYEKPLPPARVDA